MDFFCGIPFAGAMSITRKPYGMLPDGQPVELFTLRNAHGLMAEITNYGGIIVSLHAPDRQGQLADICLGKKDLQGYLAGHPFFGAITGRVAGRITAGRFTLDGIHYELETNDEPNHLHGGSQALDKALWQAALITEGGIEKLRLSYRDPEGSNGYPGNLDGTVTYSLREDNGLWIEYAFTTDKATPLTVTNHSYFNLKGDGEGDILDHNVQIWAQAYAPTDAEMTLLGEKRPVEGTPEDFRQPVRLAERIDHLFLRHGSAYFLDGGHTAEPRRVARFSEAGSGRILEVFTTEPMVQFYTGAMMEPGEPGKRTPYDVHSGLCCETQNYADGVNRPELGDIILRPGQHYASTTIYRLATDKQ